MHSITIQNIYDIVFILITYYCGKQTISKCRCITCILDADEAKEEPFYFVLKETLCGIEYEVSIFVYLFEVLIYRLIVWFAFNQQTN